MGSRCARCSRTRISAPSSARSCSSTTPDRRSSRRRRQRRGVGEHPHRGFETVTIVYAGEVEHRDSSGGGGRIGPGDVQWMTAAGGLVHEEFHGHAFARRGGPFEMVQLWVNLPAKDKWSPPRYQAITRRRHPDRGPARHGEPRARHRRRARRREGAGADLHADPRLGPAARRRHAGRSRGAGGLHDAARGAARVAARQRFRREHRRRRSRRCSTAPARASASIAPNRRPRCCSAASRSTSRSSARVRLS